MPLEKQTKNKVTDDTTICKNQPILGMQRWSITLNEAIKSVTIKKPFLSEKESLLASPKLMKHKPKIPNPQMPINCMICKPSLKNKLLTKDPIAMAMKPKKTEEDVLSLLMTCCNLMTDHKRMPLLKLNAK